MSTVSSFNVPRELESFRVPWSTISQAYILPQPIVRAIDTHHLDARTLPSTSSKVWIQHKQYSRQHPGTCLGRAKAFLCQPLADLLGRNNGSILPEMARGCQSTVVLQINLALALERSQKVNRGGERYLAFGQSDHRFCPKVRKRLAHKFSSF